MLIPTCMIKLMELILAVSCLVLHHYSYDLTDIPTLMICSGTYIGYIVVFSGEVIGECLFAPLDLVQDMYFGIVGTVLFAVSGAMVLSGRLKESQYPHSGDYVAAVLQGSLALVTATMMFFDLSLAYLDSDEFDDEATEAVSASADAYVDSWWSASGSALFAACGYLTLKGWRDVPESSRRSLAVASAACALATAALLILDALIAYCSAHRDDAVSRTASKSKACTQC